MICKCEVCFRLKSAREIANFFLTITCKECAEKLYKITDQKLKRAFGIL